MSALGHKQTFALSGPLYPRKRTFADTAEMLSANTRRGGVKRAFENVLFAEESLVTRPNYLSGATVVFEEPSGAACIPGGDWPCGLEGGAPPVPVSIGPVQPCGCFWPFVSGTGVWVRPVLYSGLSYLNPSACTEIAKLAIQTGKIAMYAKRICCPRTLSGQHGTDPSVPERVAKGYRQDNRSTSSWSRRFKSTCVCDVCDVRFTGVPSSERAPT